MREKGIFTITLDFELLWGVFDVLDYENPFHKETFRNTRRIIPRMLSLFENENVHVTWAVVGMLLNRSWQEWNTNFPALLPKYKNTVLSSYSFGKKIQTSGNDDLVFAPELVKRIMGTEGQEIGSHTYSHYYCMEDGQNPATFRSDLNKAIESALNFGIHLQSLVFPRNQVSREYLKICFECGITSVRTNPDVWYWQNPTSENFITKVSRTGDAYNPLGSKKSYSLQSLKKEPQSPLEQKASRFLRPYEEVAAINRVKLKRILAEMTYAARKGEVYHLWWHPHNFGHWCEENMENLLIILTHYKKLKHRYGMESCNMREIYSIYLKEINRG